MPSNLLSSLISLNYDTALLLSKVERKCIDELVDSKIDKADYSSFQHDRLRRQVEFFGEQYRKALKSYLTAMELNMFLDESIEGN